MFMSMQKSIPLSEKIRALPRTLFAYFMGLPIILFLFIPALIFAAIPARYRPEKLFFRILHLIYASIVTCVLLPVTTTGRENMPQTPAIFVSNHESSLDIPLLGRLMRGYPHMWYVFAIFARKPFFGFLVRRIGMPVDQANAGADARALVSGIRRVNHMNMHTLIFPEGSRFNDGVIHKFYSGFALIAKKTGRPVIPVLMRNAGKAYPPHGFFIYYAPLSLTIGPAFYCRADESLKEFTERVHAWFDEENERMHERFST